MVRRLPREARRAQLVEVGIRLSRRLPFEAIGAAEIAAAAGVSKALVFHYFPTTEELHAAIARHEAARLLADLETDPALPHDQRLRIGLESFITHIERSPASYRSMARGAASSAVLREVYEDARQGVCTMILRALGVAADPPAGVVLLLRGWIAMVEEMTLLWLDEASVPRETLVTLLHHAGLTNLPAALETEAAGR